MTFDKPEVVFDNASSEQKETGSFTISNEGQYKLTYSLRLDPNGVGETVEETGGDGGIAPWQNNNLAKAMTDAERDELIKAKTASIQPNQRFEGFQYDVPPFDCNNILYYPILGVDNPSAYRVGTGSSNLTDNYCAATRYTAPAEGFNLSHLYFVGTIGNLENVDIEATVIGSSDVTSDRVIGHGKLRVEKEEPTTEDPDNPENNVYSGAPRLLEFDKPVYINPNDTFYVVLKYPAGYQYSALIVQKSDRVRAGRYMEYYKGQGWIDLGQTYEQQYGSLGYFMTCVEMEPGEAWIRLLETETEGEIAIGGSKEVKVEVNAASAYFDKDNKAVVVIKSNDPTQPVVNYPIILNRNAAPVITVLEGTTTVPEGSKAEVAINVADAEGEAFTVAVADESGISTVTSAKLTDADGTEDATLTDGAVSVPAGKSLSLTMELAPDYGTAGLHYIELAAKDASGNASSASVPYNVEFTNRAPVYEGATEMTVYVGNNTGIISYETLFSDPDGDAMTYSATMPDNRFAEILTSSNGFLISGNAVGSTELTIKATDAAGATTPVKVAVTVSDASGIGSVTSDKDINVYPNPVDDRVNVTLGSAASNVNYYVYDNGGRLITSAHADSKAAGEVQTIDMGQCAAGVYRIKVAASGRSHTATVIKK